MARRHARAHRLYAPDDLLTPGQAAHLRILRDHGALSEAAAREIAHLRNEGAVAQVLVKLCEKGLAQRRHRTVRGRSFTLYWLTPAGALRANLLPKDAA